MASERDITFRLRVRDDSGPAFDGLKGKAQAAAPAVNGVVSADLGKRLNHFNETGQKAAYMLGQMGGSAGMAASQMTRYGGVLSSLVGRISPLEAGLLAAGIAVVALGAKLYDLAAGPIRDSREAIMETAKALKTATDAIHSYYEATMIAFSGMSQAQQLRRTQAIELNKLDTERLTHERLMFEQAKMVHEQVGGNLLEHYMRIRQNDEAYQELTKRIEDTRKAAAELAEVEQLGAVRAVRDIAGAGVSSAAGVKPKAGKAGKAAKREVIDYGPGRNEYEAQQEEEAFQYQLAEDMRMDAIEREQEQEDARVQYLADADRYLWKLREQNAEEYWAYREELDARQLEREKELAEAQVAQSEAARESMNRTVGQAGAIGAGLVGIYEKIAVSTAKSEKEASKHRAIAAALMAALKIGEEIALAASSFASQDYLSGALHVVAAATWAAQAATANMQGGGGGGTSVAAAAPGPADRQYWQERKESGEAGGINLHIHGDVISGHQAGELIEDLLKYTERKRNPTAPRSELEV